MKEGNGLKVIHEIVSKVYGNDRPSYFQVKFSPKQSQWRLDSIQDDLRSGRSVEAARTHESIRIGEELLRSDQRMKILVPGNPQFLIAYEDLGMKKVSAQLIHKLEQKLARAGISQHLATLENDESYNS